eukprot:1080760-Amorphochlora_amoeboformis.AAC.1
MGKSIRSKVKRKFRAIKREKFQPIVDRMREKNEEVIQQVVEGKNSKVDSRDPLEKWMQTYGSDLDRKVHASTPINGTTAVKGPPENKNDIDAREGIHHLRVETQHLAIFILRCFRNRHEQEKAAHLVQGSPGARVQKATAGLLPEICLHIPPPAPLYNPLFDLLCQDSKVVEAVKMAMEMVGEKVTLVLFPNNM